MRFCTHGIITEVIKLLKWNISIFHFSKTKLSVIIWLLETLLSKYCPIITLQDKAFRSVKIFLKTTTIL